MDTFSKRHVIGDPVDPKPGPMPQPSGPPKPVPGPTPGPPSPPRPDPEPTFKFAAAMLLLLFAGAVEAQRTDAADQPETLSTLPHEFQRLAALRLPPLKPLVIMQQPGPWLSYSDSIADLLLLDMDQRNKYKELDAGYNAEIDRTNVDMADKLEHQWMREQQMKSILHGDQLPKWEKLRGAMDARKH